MREQKTCNQVNVPSVNNTCIECDNFTYDTCVKVKKGHVSIKNGSNIVLSEYLDRVGDSLKEVRYNLGKIAKNITGKDDRDASTIKFSTRGNHIRYEVGSNLEEVISKIDLAIREMADGVRLITSEVESNKKFSKIVSDKKYSTIASAVGDSLSEVVKLIDLKLGKLDVEDSGLKNSLSQLERDISLVDLKADGISRRVSDLDPRFRALHQSIDNLRLYLEAIDYKKVVISDGNRFFDVPRGATMDTLISGIRNKFDNVSSSIQDAVKRAEDIKRGLGKTSGIIVDRQLLENDIQYGESLNNVLSLFDEKIRELIDRDTSGILVKSGKISTSGKPVILDDLLVSLVETQGKYEMLKEQFDNLKAQVDILRRK